MNPEPAEAVTLRVVVNGEELRVPAGSTVQDLCARFGADPRHTAVERNRVIVSRAQFATTELQDGDVLEIVTLVGGG